MTKNFINHWKQPTMNNFNLCMFCYKIIAIHYDWCEECEDDLEKKFDELLSKEKYDYEENKENKNRNN